MSDGAYAIAVGKLGWLADRKVTAVGGNCSVTVLDSSGVEVYWTVTGDIVLSISIFDFDGDGTNEASNRCRITNQLSTISYRRHRMHFLFIFSFHHPASTWKRGF